MKLKTSFLTALGTAILSLSTLQLAQAAFVENQYNCEDAYMEVAYDCGNNAIIVEKNRLNKIYMSVYRTLNTTQQQQLDKEQVVWLKNRNKHCEFKQEGSMNNMAVWGMIGADVCTANETQKRSKVIAKKYNIK